MIALKRSLDKILGWVLVVLMAISVINVLWQVFSRFVLNDPSTFTDELARFLLIWVGILGAAYAAGKHLHLAIDLFQDRASDLTRQKVMVFVDICIFLFSFLVMVIGGWSLVSVSFELGQLSPALQLPLGYIYLVVPISGLIMCFYSLVFLKERIKVLKGGTSELDEVSL